jgi:hypothetical protein
MLARELAIYWGRRYIFNKQRDGKRVRDETTMAENKRAMAQLQLRGKMPEIACNPAA